MGDDAPAAVAEAVRECSPAVSTFLVCSGAGSCYWPTRVGHVDPRAEALVAAHARGLDPLGMWLKALKAAGKETFITYRMNDVHNPTDPDGWNTPRIRRERPDCIVGLDEVRSGKAGWMSYCMDYARADVRQYVADLIREQVGLYGRVIDGFQLDWMRFPRHLSGSPEQVWEKRQVLTDFTAQVRDILNEAGRRILLSARVPTTPAGCRRLGMDVAEWCRRGLVDLLVVCPFLTTDWRIPIQSFRDLMGGARVPVYAGFDLGFGWQVHFPESLRGVCTSLYDCGPDGIYLFNFPCWIERLAARPYHWLDGLNDPTTAAAKPMLLALDHKRSRVEGVDQPATIPAAVPTGGSFVAGFVVPRAALPAWRALCLVQSGGDVTLAVNDTPARELRAAEQPSGPFRSEVFMEFDNHYREKRMRPRPDECRVFRIDPAALRAGENRFAFGNPSGQDRSIERVNLALW
jgi:hypothetical protein